MESDAKQNPSSGRDNLFGQPPHDMGVTMTISSVWLLTKSALLKALQVSQLVDAGHSVSGLLGLLLDQARHRYRSHRMGFPAVVSARV